MSDIVFAPAASVSKPELRAPISQRPSALRLKICFIAETVHAGVGRHVVDMITSLSARGHEIHLIYSPIRTDLDFLNTILGLRNVHCEAIAMPRAIGPADVSVFRKILSYIRAQGPFDVIHGQSSKGGGYARLLKLFGYGPVLYSPHAFVTMSPLLPAPKRAIYRALEWSLGMISDRVICTSIAEHDHARELGLPEERLTVIVNGNTPSPAPPREVVRKRLDIREDQVVIGYAGRMEEQKAPERLIAAARALLPGNPNLVLVMIGGGPKLEALKSALAGSGIETRVRWLGPVDARQYLPGFDIFVLPSLYEGCAYVLLEALSAGLPIVATPVGGTHEAVEEGVNGMIVPHEAADALAGAIARIATNPGLRRAMGEASRHRASYFSVPRMIQSVEGLYIELVRAKSGTPTGVTLPAPAVSSR